MAASPGPPPNWHFGAFELEERSGELRRNGVPIHLQEQPRKLLVYLLQHAGQIVTRDDLRLHLWPADTFVDFDHALNTAVMKLREALRDSREKPLYIQTIPRKGYRFIAPVSVVPSDPIAPPANEPPASEQVAASAISHNPATPETAAADPLTSTREPLTITLKQIEDPPQKISRTVKLLALAAILLFFLALAVTVTWKTARSTAESTRSLTRVTFEEGLQFDPTWSPDGRYLAYTAVRGGTTNIWMQQIGVGEPIQITSGPGPNWQPDWSPDGKYIAYRSDAGSGGLFIIPALGGAGQERRIAYFGYNPHWSPDSQQILFQEGPLPWRGVSPFYLIGLDGAPPRRVLDDFFQQHNSLVSISAAWHPDGQRITVWVDDPARSGSSPHFWTVPVHGGAAVYSEMSPQIEQKFRELGVPSGDEWLLDAEFTWAPAGNAIYLERTFRSARNLWRLNVNPKTLQATSIDQLTSSGFDTVPSLSPDGKRLAFTAATATVSAWLFPFDANHGRFTGAGRPVTSPGTAVWLTSASQDGNKLAFTGVRAGETRLWVKALPDGREVPLFVDDQRRVGPPAWSPDGTRLAYFRIGHNPDQAQIMIWSEQTRQEEPLTSFHPLGDRRLELVYDWTLDGKSLLVSKTRWVVGAVDKPNEVPGEFPDMAAWRLPLSAAPHAESQERMLVSDPAYAIYQPHQSPDGRWIVFLAVSRQRSQPGAGPSSLYVMRASGGPWLPIVMRNWVDKPRWSPDGRTIYFFGKQGSFFDVWGIHFDPDTGKTVGDPFRLTTLDNPGLRIPAYVGSAGFSVTQKSLVLTLNQVSGSISVLDNVDR
jgi:Tol biopolymer transport system component/DNA-binding winged helix-turn-helix (wHTH) protein